MPCVTGKNERAMSKVKDGEDAIQIALEYTDKALKGSPEVEEVIKESSDKWIVIISNFSMTMDDVYQIHIDANSGSIEEVRKKGTVPKVIDSLERLLNSVKETILSILFLVREVKGKNP